MHAHEDGIAHPIRDIATLAQADKVVATAGHDRFVSRRCATACTRFATSSAYTFSL